MLTVISSGSRLGRYEVRSHLGGGGMGEVYLAQDTQLGRLVALKLLASELTQNLDHLHRFEQEARATSALNHPNILTIYEIGQADTRHYIATEYIDGMTLRQHMGHNPLKVSEVLDIATQCAAALAAAHQAGVVHRDIKPENIMLRPDGYVKILDFGLAKLTEHLYQQFANPELSTAPNINTDPGTIIGTVLYMSPEQVRGQKVDARTDIWSLGVVLYEMCAGRVPFDGSSKSDVIVSILEREQPPLARYAPSLPAELQRIVSKTLHKDREDRYQTAQDLLIDLRTLKQELDFAAKLKYTQRSATSEGADTVPSNGIQAADETSRSKRTDLIRPARPTSSIDYLVNEIGRHKKVTLLLGLLMMLALAGLTYRRFQLGALVKSSNTSQLTFTKLNTTGNVLNAVISPDGKYVATVIEDAGKQSLRVRQVGASNEVQLVAPAEVQYGGITFSRDGTSIYYNTLAADGGVLYQVPVLGGASRKLLANVTTTVTESPDGKQLAFVREDRQTRGTALMIANADGSEERRLASRQRPEVFTLGGTPSNGPAWSPNGKVIACPTLSLNEPFQMNVVEVSVANGSMRRINTQGWYEVEQVAWLRDSSALIMNAREDASLPFQVWRLSYPNGEAQRITNDPNSYEVVSLTEDSSTLAALQTDQLSNIWIVPDGETERAVQLTSGKYQGSDGLAWTPGGELVYASNENGNDDIWLMEANGSNHRQLTFDSHRDIQPIVSQDGRYTVFVSFRSGLAHIWRMDADGSNPKQLTNGRFENSPQFSPDGRWVVYHNLDPAGDSIWKVSIDGGAPILLTDKMAKQPAVSPDGKLIACFSRDVQTNSAWKIIFVPFDGGAPTQFFNVPSTVNPVFQALRWTPDGRALNYSVTQNGVSNIWSQPLDGSPPKQLTNFKENKIFSFAWSLDGKQLACVRGIETHDVVLIKNFK